MYAQFNGISLPQNGNAYSAHNSLLFMSKCLG